jgi:hypothetical protein
MEWFCHISPGIPAETLVEQCTLTALPALCAGVHAVPEIDAAGRRATIECVWGVFTATVEPIRHGVRYALTTCPNAMDSDHPPWKNHATPDYQRYGTRPGLC